MKYNSIVMKDFLIINNIKGLINFKSYWKGILIEKIKWKKVETTVEAIQETTVVIGV